MPKATQRARNSSRRAADNSSMIKQLRPSIELLCRSSGSGIFRARQGIGSGIRPRSLSRCSLALTRAASAGRSAMIWRARQALTLEPVAAPRRDSPDPAPRRHRHDKSRSAAQARRPETIAFHLLIRHFLADNDLDWLGYTPILLSKWQGSKPCEPEAACCRYSTPMRPASPSPRKASSTPEQSPQPPSSTSPRRTWRTAGRLPHIETIA